MTEVEKILYKKSGGEPLIPQNEKSTATDKVYSCKYVNDNCENMAPETVQTTSDSNTYSCNYINENCKNQPDQYSTTETVTNKIWKDGKQIYRTVLANNYYASGSITVDIGTITDFEALTSSDIIINSLDTSGEFAQIDEFFVGNLNDNKKSGIKVKKSTGVVTLNLAGFSGYIQFNVILEYTKVTPVTNTRKRSVKK